MLHDIFIFQFKMRKGMLSVGNLLFCFSQYVFKIFPEVFLGKDVLKICSKITGEHPCQKVILIKLLCNFIETALLHGDSPVNLLHIFRTPFLITPLGGCFCISSITLRLVRFLREYLFFFISHLEF